MSNFTNKDRQMLVEVHTEMKNVIKVMDDHEQRIRANTKFRNTLLGWIAGAGGLGAALTKVTDKFFS